MKRKTRKNRKYRITGKKILKRQEKKFKIRELLWGKEERIFDTLKKLLNFGAL